MTTDTPALPANARVDGVLSIVPMTRPVDLSLCLSAKCDHCRDYGRFDVPVWMCPYCAGTKRTLGYMKGRMLSVHVDIVRVGGGDEPLHPDWVRSVRDQCEAAGVAFVFVGWGEWSPYGYPLPDLSDSAKRFALVRPDGSFTVSSNGDLTEHLDGNEGCAAMAWVGKAASGRILDGRTHDWPKVTP